MPHHCAAWGCTNRQNKHNRLRGITFHRFPTNKILRKQWEVALRREAFVATSHSRLCSEHFGEADFDRTGQTVRIRDGVVPSVFNSQAHLRRLVGSRTSWTSNQADTATPQNQSVDSSPPVTKEEPQPDHSLDHSYALPTCPGAMAKVESLEREKRNARDGERRAESTVCGLLEELRAKNLINEELKEKLDLYSDLPVHLLSKQGLEYTKDQKEFALTLHLHGPKAYTYLRESLHLNLPHPHTLQRWMKWMFTVSALGSNG